MITIINSAVVGQCGVVGDSMMPPHFVGRVMMMLRRGARRRRQDCGCGRRCRSSGSVGAVIRSMAVFP